MENTDFSTTETVEVIRHLRAELTPHSGRMVHLEGPGLTSGCVDHRLGRLAFAAGDLDEAESLLRGALAQNQSFRARHWAWHASVSLAGVLLANGDPASIAMSDGLLVEAVTEAEAMGMPTLGGLIDALVASRAVSSRPRP